MCAQFNSLFEFVKCTAFQQYALCFPSSVFWMFVFVVFLSWEYLVCLLVLCFLLCNVYFVCVCTVLLMSCKGNFFIVKISTIDHNKGGYTVQDSSCVCCDSMVKIFANFSICCCVMFDLRSRRWTVSSTKESSAAGHGWNLYVVDTVPPFTLYQEMVTLICPNCVLRNY